MKIPNIAAISKLEAAFSYGAIKSSEIKKPDISEAIMMTRLRSKLSTESIGKGAYEPFKRPKDSKAHGNERGTLVLPDGLNEGKHTDENRLDKRTHTERK